jgi:hypothetical protein
MWSSISSLAGIGQPLSCRFAKMLEAQWCFA